MHEVTCGRPGCGFVARGEWDDEVAAWCWHHECLAHDGMPDLATIRKRVVEVPRGAEVGFPGTASAIKFLPAHLRRQEVTA